MIRFFNLILFLLSLSSHFILSVFVTNKRTRNSMLFSPCTYAISITISHNTAADDNG